MSSRVWCRSTRALHPARTEASSAMGNLLRPRVARSVTAELVGRAVPCPPDLSGCTDGGASRTCGTRPTNSLRLCCEGLEEKFLERGAPAPLSVPLIDDFGVAEHRIQAERPGPHEQLRRAVDCAPYRFSASLGRSAHGHLGRSDCG